MKIFIKNPLGLLQKTLNSINSSFFYLFLLFSMVSFFAQAQTDTRFWFAAPDVTQSHGDRPIRIVVSAFDVAATVTITQPANLFFPTYVVSVPANSSRFVDITASINLVETPVDTPTPITPQVSRTGLLVESTAKITAYYEVVVSNNTDIFALKGKNGLGLDFYVPFQDRWRHRQDIGDPDLTRRGRSGFVIVATENGTTITVTPTTNLEGGQLAGTPFTVVLNRGQTYVGSVSQPTAGNFPSGSRIQSDKPVAVTKYSDSINTGTDASPSGCFDLAGDQLIPVNIVGTEYVVLRGGLGSGASNPELVVITATRANTQVRVNGGLVATLNAGQTHTYELALARVFVTTSEPAYVGHYAGFGCETGFAILPPVNCTGSLTTRVTRSTDETFFINLMTRGTPVNSNFDFTNNFTIRVTTGAITTTLFSPSTTPFPATFSQIGTSDYYATQYEFNLTQVPVESVVTIESTTVALGTDEAGLFHLGVVNGNGGNGVRYGYFSDFRSLDLGSDLNINYGTNTTITADIQATNFQWFSDNVSVQNGLSNSYTVTDIQRRQTIRLIATVGDCFLVDSICVGTLEYVWDGRFTGGIGNDQNWSKPCGATGVPTCDIDIIIPPTPIAFSALNVLNGQILNVRNISILSAASINGSLNINTGGAVNVCGNMVHNGTLNMSPNSTFSFIGAGRQNYSKGTTGLGDFENLIIANTIGTSTFNNVTGVTILSSSAQDLSVSTTGTLNFVQGYIVPEDFPNSNGVDISRSVIVKNPNTNAITGFAGAGATTQPNQYFIAGKLNRAKNPTGNYAFPVGLVLQEPSVIQPEPTKTGTMQIGTNQLGFFEDDDWQTASYGPGGTCNPNPNGVLRMNDTGEYIDFDTNRGNVGVAGGAARTVEIWANVAEFNQAGLFQFGAALPVAGDFALRTTNTDNNWEIRLGGGITLDVINLPNSRNNWRHYALTYNGNAADPQVAFYYDGQLIRNYELKDGLGNPIPLNTIMNWALVGRFVATDPGLALRGQVDELKVWSEQRTAAQIRETFLQGCNSNALQCPQSNNLRAYYNFNDGIINGTGTRTVQSRTITCPVPTFTYQRADANFNGASSVDNITASFKQYIATVPNVTGQSGICNGNFVGQPALNNGFWDFSSFNASVATPVNNPYMIFLYNRDFTNVTGVSTTVMKHESPPYTGTPPWIIPPGLCEANTPVLTGRSGFTGNMGFFGTAQSLDPTLLPVELLFISAKPVENAILVEWATLQELDNYGFEIFRAEENGEFVKIGFVKGKNNSTTRQDYNFLDIEVQPNINYYYKLKQIDNIGKFSFTKTVTAKLSDSDFTGEQINTIYPNPTDDNFTLYLGGKEFKNAKQIQISLVNAIGAELESRTVNTQSGNRINFRLTRYPKGIYLLRIVSETSSAVLKVVKE